METRSRFLPITQINLKHGVGTSLAERDINVIKYQKDAV
jgi:hypothetical protein